MFAKLIVFAAASLTNVFPQIASAPHYSFGASNMLAAQIQQGAPADVFASANTKLPDELHAKGLCSTPIVFTRNRLVIVVPKANPAHIHTVYDLTKTGVKVDIAAAGVPVGDYTRTVLANLKLTAKVFAHVVSQETDVREVLSKIVLGDADAGFVYATDAKTSSGRVRVIGLPAAAQPVVRYAACVVTSGKHQSAANAFISALIASRAQAKLVAAGFLPR